MSIVDTNVDDQDSVAKGDGDQLQLVTFEVADEEFAVNILAVQEINRMMEITRVPQAPPEVQGVINLRGKIIPVVDIRKRFNLDERDHNSDNRIIVVKVQGRVIGFIVDCVHEVLRINTSIVEPPPSMITSIDSDFIEGVGKLDDRLIILLDLDKLFATELLEEMERVADAKAA